MSGSIEMPDMYLLDMYLSVYNTYIINFYRQELDRPQYPETTAAACICCGLAGRFIVAVAL